MLLIGALLLVIAAALNFAQRDQPPSAADRRDRMD
jgi:hypothetical protein